jgi:putative transposase
MKRSRFNEEQIIGMLKEHQAGLRSKELCRKYGVSDATFYKWRSKIGGMEVPDVKKLKSLEAENAKLKKLLAEQMMDVSTLKEMLGKTFEAWIATQCCGLGREREAIQSEARLRVIWDRSACLSPGIQATSGY